MKNILNFTFTIILTILLVSSCTSDKKDIAADDMTGKWELKEATRNGKKTGTLKGIFFDINKDGKIKTNFNMDMTEKSSTYKIEDGTIVIDGNPPIKLNAERTLDDELILKANLMNSKFKLILQPAVVVE